MKLPVSLRRQQSVGLFLEVILITSAIAASAGVGFGAALRFNRPAESGSTLLHDHQSFPPRQDWPIGNPSSINNN